MNWLYYLAEANLYLGVFYLAYCLFLTKETYYQLTRVYLLFACVASFILPVLQIGALKPVEAAVATTVAYTLPEYTAPQEYISTETTAPIVIEHHLTVDDYLMYVYLAGAAIVFLMLIVKLFTLFKLMHNAKRIKQEKYKLVYLPQTNVAFSFFNYLFIGADASGANTIIRHELVHIRQRHSVDIVFLELLKVVSWFNPFIYLLQNSLKTVHEYIADEQTAAHETDTLTYSSFLVNNAYGAGASSITHSFFNYNLLKKRIVMLNQQRSGNLARLKYLVAVPVCAGLLCASTLAFSKTYGWVDIDPAKPVENIITEHPVEAAAPKKPAFPIPSFTSKGYEYLQHQIMKTVIYNPTEKDKGAFVVVGFDVANDGKLTNIKIDKSAGRELDAKALNAYKTFNMPVNDKPGHRRSLIIFYKGQPTAETNAYHDGEPKCISSWVISGMPFLYKVKRTGKGFEYDEYSEYLDNKFNTRTVIYDANGKYVTVSFNKATAGQLALLKNKYGYTFPPLPKNPVKFPPPIVKPDAKASTQKPDTITKAGLTAFYTHLLNNIKYPSSERDKGINGCATVEFNVDNNNHITYIKMIKSPTDNFSREIIRVLKSSPYLKAFKGGSWTLPVSFNLNGYTLPTAYLPLSNIVYNPNGFNVPAYVPTQKLTEVVIRGYTKADVIKDPVTTENATRTDWEKVSSYLANNIKYPVGDRQNGIEGRVYTVFAFDANNKLMYAKVVRTPSNSLGNEVIRALRSYTGSTPFKPGQQYTLSIEFSINGIDNGALTTAAKNEDALNIYNPNNLNIAYHEYDPVLRTITIRSYAERTTGALPDLEQFYQYLSQNVHYPAADRHDFIGGRVITVFTVDDNGSLQYAKVVRSPSDLMSNEVMRILKKWPLFFRFKPGVPYAVPVSFTLGYEGSSNGIKIETKSRAVGTPPIYNPNAVDIPVNTPGSLMLNEVVIRGYIKMVTSTGKASGDATKPDLTEFKNYFVNTIKYPVEAKQQGITGQVFTLFSVDNNHKVASITVMKSPADRLSNEVMNVLKAMPAMAALKPGATYVLPVYFSLPRANVVKPLIFTEGSKLTYKSGSAIASTGDLITIPINLYEPGPRY